MTKVKEMRTYILTMPTRGTQTVLIDGLTAKDAIGRWRAGEGEPWRADHEITWSGAPKAIVDGGWIGRKVKAKPSEGAKTK